MPKENEDKAVEAKAPAEATDPKPVTTPQPLTLGKTATRVFDVIATANDDGVTAREITTELNGEIEIGQIRMILRSLKGKHGIVLGHTAEGSRTIHYVISEDAIERLDLGNQLAAERKAKRGTREPVEPMPQDQYEEALKTVSRYDILITRYTGLLNRDRRENGDNLPTRSYVLEGEAWTGTAGDLVRELRDRRSQLAALPSYRAALKQELDQCISGGDIIESELDDAAAA